MKRFWMVCLFLVFGSFCSGASASCVEIVLDVSGSMRAPMGGQSKIDVAKQAIQSTIQGIEEGSIVALRFYGHRVQQQKRAESCRDTELVIPFEPLNKSRFQTVLDQADPLGQTPIAYSLEQAAEDLKSAKDEQGVIILVSDGEETCGGDPVEVACKLAKEGIHLTVHTIGFDVDSKTRRQLEGIARCTGGEYRDARNAEALAENLQGLTRKGLLIEERRSAHGQEIRGGKMYDDAVQIQPGITYHLDHHQRKDEYDYFYFDVKHGQKITASIFTGERGVKIQGSSFREVSHYSYAGFELHSPERIKVAYENIIGKPNSKEQRRVPIGRGQGGRFYLLIGSHFDDQHQESRFSIDLEDQYDAGSGTDAGTTVREAVKILPGKHSSYFHTNDVIDFYHISNVSRVTIQARAEDPEIRLEMRVEDEDGKILSKALAPNEGAVVKIENLQLPGNHAFVKLSASNRYHNDGKLCVALCQYFESPYELEVIQTGAAPAAEKRRKPGTPAHGPEKSDVDRNQNYVFYTLGGGALFFLFLLTGLAIYFIRKRN